MRDRLLTLDDLCEFYSTKKRAAHFSCKDNDEPVVVQTKGTMFFEESEDDEDNGLLGVSFQHALHTGENLNHSAISKEVMEEKLLPTFVNRPILGYIHYINDVPYFKGHEMHIDPDTDEIVYDEVPVGIVPESNNAKLVYDEENDRYNVWIDGYIFEEYSQAAEIIKREGVCNVSVEIAIKEMSYAPKDGVLVIEDGYFSGITILGKDENGNEIKPGMAGSKVTLKDFKRNNNSMFSGMSVNSQAALVNILEKLNNTLSSLYINQENYRKEESTAMKDKDLQSVAGEEETAATELESESQDTPEVAEENYAAPDDEEPEDETPEEEPEEGEESEEGDEPEDEGDDEEEPEDEPEEEPEDDEDSDEKERETESFSAKYVRTYELSHEDIRCALYNLLEAYEETNNDCYCICEVYDDYFIYQSWMTGEFYRQSYLKDDATDMVAFVGEPEEMYAMFLTEAEKLEVEKMRNSYDEIETELESYKTAELNAQREEILSDQAYSKYMDTDEFKEIKDNVQTYSIEELREKCDMALGKVQRKQSDEIKKANFSLEGDAKKSKAPFFGFAKSEHESKFLDEVLKNAKKGK